MKKILVGLSSIALGILCVGLSYAGSATASLQVSATVTGYCTVSTGAVNFGNVTGQTTVNATGDISVNCSANLPYFIALDAGLHFAGPSVYRKIANGDYSARYLLGPSDSSYMWGDAGYGNTFSMAPPVPDTGTGANQPHTVNAQLQTFSGIPGGTVLTDTVTVTVIY